MTRQQAAACCALVLLAGFFFHPVPLEAQELTKESVAVLHRWVDAVNEHVPGRPDAAVQAITAMTYGARRTLNPSYALFMRVLRQELITTRHDIDKTVTAFARGIRNEPGTQTFLKRAAVLHADAVVFASRFPTPPDDAPPVAPKKRKVVDQLTPDEPDDLPPLLTNQRFPLTRDGQVVGQTAANWNLPVARSLLVVLLRQDGGKPFERLCDNQHCEVVESALPPVPRDDFDFVADWYHAVSAYLFANGMNGDATAHLKQAARALPDDARALFDRAAYAETFGLPIYQTVPDAGVPPEDRTNAEAERLYRRVLEVDPAYVEARVRLARLLDHRGRHDEAASEIDRALEAQPAGVLGFYARTIAGRIATARGRYKEAVQHYRGALQLFRDAQSALLGASQAALMAADLPEALALLAPLRTSGGIGAGDPWWDYQLGAGRDADALLAALWARVGR